MTVDLLQYGLGALSGSLVGFTLGLVGGGASILVVPLMVYLVGVHNPHIAIGTSALAMAANAAIGTINHARGGTVKSRCALMYAGAGIAGAAVGSTAGKAFDGQQLLMTRPEPSTWKREATPAGSCRTPVRAKAMMA